MGKKETSCTPGLIWLPYGPIVTLENCAVHERLAEWLVTANPA